MALNKLTRIGNSGFGTDTSINTTGIVTAASFSGDGSELTGITAVGSGVVVREEGSNVGTAQTINFIGTGVTATISGGVASIEITTSGGGGGGLSDIVSDTTPQLGGNLDVNGKDITGTGGVNLTGVVTATTFVGALTGNASGNAATATTLQNARTIGGVSFDGSANINLPGVNAAGNQDTSGTASVATNVTIADESSDTSCFLLYSTEATGNIAPKTGSNLTFNSSSGTLTASTFVGDGSGLTGIVASGSGVIVRDDGSLVGTAGTIDFGTNVAVSPISAGVVTVTASAGSIAGINTSGTTELNNLTVAGVSTFQSSFVRMAPGGGDSGILKLGSGNNYQIIAQSNKLQFAVAAGKSIELNGGNSVYLRTSNTGIDITGGLTVSGISTFTGNIDANGDLDVDGHTNLDNVSISGVCTATTFSGSGANLTNLDASDLASGTIPDARFPATLPAVSGANLTNLPSDTPADTDVQVTYDVSSNGSSAYRFTGPGYSGADDNPDIYLVRGQRYRFINGTGSGHPFRIQSDTSGTAYTDGVSGSQSGTQDFNVQHDAPVRLYYQCTIHSGMIGNIYVVGASDWRMTDVATNATPNIFTNLNVGIGSEIPATTLDVAGTGQFKNNGSALKIESDPGNNYTQVEFKNDGGSFFVGRENSAGNWFATGSNYASILRSDGAYPLIFSVNGAQRLRIDSSGNMGLGTNSPNNQSGYTSLTLNNATSGSIIDLRRNDVALSGGRLVGFENEFGLESRSQSSNSQISFYVNNAYAGRFTSDGLCFGSDTAAANALDDYEEGTFTFTITAGVTSPTYTSTAGTYTKIGNCVTFTARMQVASGTANGSQVRMGGLPFASSSTLNSGGASFSYLGNINGNGDIPLAFIPKNHTEIILYGQNGGTWNGDRGNNIISSTLHIHGHYYV